MEQIENLQIEDCEEVLVSRAEVRLSVDGILPLLTDQDIVDELVLYKAELIEAEVARLAEIARVAVLNARFEAISDLRLAMHRIGDNTPNMSIFKRDIVNENKSQLLESLEVADQENQAEVAAELPMKNRAAEYSKLDVMLLEALAEQAGGQPEKMEEYLILRNQIKLDNPK